MRRLVTLFLVIPLLGAVAAPAMSQTSTDELLSGMVTEEVEPGIYRVINDGVRDFGWGSAEDGPYDIVAGHDGSVWLFDWPHSSVRLGDGTEYDWVAASPDHAVDVTPDGSVWRIDTAGSISSFDGRTWTQHRPATNSDDEWNQSALKVGPDGMIWALSIDGDLVCSDPTRAGCRHTVLTSLDGDRAPTTTQGWSELYDGAVAADALTVSPDGEVWLVGVRGTQTSGAVEVLLRYDGQAWQVVEVPDGLRNAWAGQSFDIGADGTLWAAAFDLSADGDSLARLDDAGWTVFSDADGVQRWGTDGFIPTDHLHVAADGSVWVNAEGAGVSCGGVADFDGSTWTRYLEDLCVHDMDIAPDGAVWVRASDFKRSGGFEYWDPPDLYVITPGAVAGTE